MRLARQFGLAIFLSIAVVCSWVAPLDAPAVKQIDIGLQKALVTFATARALNGVISVLQGTQIDVQPAGIGATFSPGQVLAPVNELVKHFSDLMLLASIAFGVQKVLISISGYWAISVVLTATAGVWAWLDLKQRNPPSWLSKLLVILLMLRFAVPVVALGSNLLSQTFMASDYVASQQAIDAAMGHTSKAKLDPAVASPVSNGSLWNLITNAMPKAPNFADRFSEMKNAAEKATEHMVRLMVIFLLQTLIIPGLLLWSLYGVAKSLVERPRLSSAHDSRESIGPIRRSDSGLGT